MKPYLRRLSAAQELLIHKEAKRAFEYLEWLCGDLSGQDREGLWAAAHNAALTAFSLHHKGRRVFYSSEEVLQKHSLEQIAKLALEYQEKFEREEK